MVMFMIKDDISFVGYRGFYTRRDYIRTRYSNLSTNEKWIYKYYLYSKRHLKEYTCDLIWRFLNNEEDEEFLVTPEMLLKECSKYKM